VRSPPPEEEGAAEELTTDELTTTPIPRTSALLREGRVGGETGVKLSPGIREGWGGRCFKIWIYFLPILLCFDW